MATQVKNAPATGAKGTTQSSKVLPNQSVEITEIRPSAKDANTIIVVLAPNTFVPDGIVKFAGDNAKAVLILGNIPFADVKTSRAIGVLADMASTQQPCKLVFDASYGVAGETYTNAKGETKTFKETGINLINERLEYSDSAIAHRNRVQDKLDVLMVNASAKAEAEILAEEKANKLVRRSTTTASTSTDDEGAENEGV